MFCGAELIDNQAFPDSGQATVGQMLEMLWHGIAAVFGKIGAFIKKYPVFCVPVLLLAAGVFVLSALNATVFSGERVARQYFLAMMNNDGSAVYRCLDLPESQFVNRDAFDRYFNSLKQQKQNVGNYTVKERKTTSSKDTEEGLTRYYQITYYLHGSGSTQTMNLELVNVPAFFGLINSYKVMSEYVALGYTIDVPTGAAVMVDDISLTDPISYDDCDRYVIPAIFCNEHSIRIVHPLGEKEDRFTPRLSYGYDSGYVCSSMPYSSSVAETVSAQAQAQLNSIVSAIVAQQGFPGEVTLTADTEAQQEINETFRSLQSSWYDASKGTGYTSIQITSQRDSSDEQYFDADSVTYRCYLRFDYNYLRRRMTWLDEIEMQNGSDDGNATLYYAYENGAWVLEGFNCQI